MKKKIQYVESGNVNDYFKGDLMVLFWRTSGRMVMGVANFPYL